MQLADYFVLLIRIVKIRNGTYSLIAVSNDEIAEALKMLDSELEEKEKNYIRNRLYDNEIYYTRTKYVKPKMKYIIQE